MKRLRKDVAPKKIRYYHCGEYGTKLGRPHYHALLFGHDFDDKKLFSVRNGVRLFTSEKLAKIWGKGFASIGEVNFESAAYVARYIMKKQTGDAAENHYETTDETTGEVIKLEQSEYATMSRRPGIARDYWELHHKEILATDSVVINGHEVKPPRYYDKIFQHEECEGFEELKKARKKLNAKHKKEQTPQRLQDRETVKRKQLQQLHRNYETGTEI